MYKPLSVDLNQTKSQNAAHCGNSLRWTDIILSSMHLVLIASLITTVDFTPGTFSKLYQVVFLIKFCLLTVICFELHWKSTYFEEEALFIAHFG